jgi:hypothetical protein
MMKSDKMHNSDFLGKFFFDKQRFCGIICNEELYYMNPVPLLFVLVL